MFHALPAAVVRSVELDTMTALYDRRSGVTHVVAEIVPTLLDVLGEQGMTVMDLAARLGLEHDRKALCDQLDELVAVGLIAAR